MRPSDIFTRQGTNTPAYCPERKAGWVFEEAAACISFLHKVERIENESFGEYFRIPRLHGGEECAGRLFRCDGCEVYAADRFGEVDPFDAVVTTRKRVSDNGMS